MKTVENMAKTPFSSHLRKGGDPSESSFRLQSTDLDSRLSGNDLIHKTYVRQAIEAGLEDSEAERPLDAKEVRARFGLKP